MIAAFLRGLQFVLIPVPGFTTSIPDLSGFSTGRTSAGAQDISKGIKSRNGRDKTKVPFSVGILILAARTTLSLPLINSTTLHVFQKQRFVFSFLRITMSPTEICGWPLSTLVVVTSLRYSFLHLFVKLSNNLRWYIARLVNDWPVLTISKCLSFGCNVTVRP